jgi:NAD(P)-dependent dehydrogenase (short-subunit alcohol dehydrogenase family)
MSGGGTGVCAVIGAGPGNGASIARRFATAGQRVAVCARNLGALEELAADISGASAFAYDASDTAAADTVFPRIRDSLGPVSTLVWNAGSAVFGNFETIDPADFQQAWEVNTRGLLLAARQVVPDMRTAGGGNIVVIGATASVKAGAAFAAFASAKAAQRSLAQSLARQLGPERIHVSYVIVDGVIDIPRMRAMLTDRPDDFFLDPDGIADNVFMLTQQGPQAWTFELDLRPFGEKW